MMRIDLVGQLCAGEVCASAWTAARVAATANAAHHVTLRILALRRLLLPPPRAAGRSQGHLPLEGGGRPAPAGREGVTALQPVLRRPAPHPGLPSAVRPSPCRGGWARLPSRDTAYHKLLSRP